MLELYREYKALSPTRKKWFRDALARRLQDYIGLIILLLLMSIEIK